MNEIQSIGSFLAQFGGIAGITAFVYILYSTKSLHPMKYLVWRLIYGQEVSLDSKVADFLKQQISLMNFRHISGIDADSLKQVHSFIDWAERDEISMETLRLIGGYINKTTMRINAEAVVNFKKKIWQVSAVGSWVFLVLAICIAFSQTGLYRVTATNTYFAVNSERFMVWNDGIIPRSEQNSKCLVGNSLTALTEPDRSAICNLVTSSTLNKQLEKGIRDIREAAAILAMLLFWQLVASVIQLRSHRAVLDIIDRKAAIDTSEIINSDGDSSSEQFLAKGSEIHKSC